MTGTFGKKSLGLDSALVDIERDGSSLDMKSVMKAKDEYHRESFPEQYDETGKHVRDFWGDPVEE